MEWMNVLNFAQFQEQLLDQTEEQHVNMAPEQLGICVEWINVDMFVSHSGWLSG